MMLQAAPRALKPAGLAQSLSAGRRLCPCSPQPYARAHRRLRSWPGALASGEASVEAVGGSPLDSGAAEVDQGISRTISDLDLVLGLQQGAAEAGAAGEEAAAVAALAATAAATTAEVEAAVAIPEEVRWALLLATQRPPPPLMSSASPLSASLHAAPARCPINILFTCSLRSGQGSLQRSARGGRSWCGGASCCRSGSASCRRRWSATRGGWPGTSSGSMRWGRSTRSWRRSSSSSRCEAAVSWDGGTVRSA